MALQPPRGATLSRPIAHTSLQSHRWLTLLIVLAAAFMVILDYNIVNVAIPTIQRELQAQYGQVQLVITGYGLAYAVLLITGGRLGIALVTNSSFYLELLDSHLHHCSVVLLQPQTF